MIGYVGRFDKVASCEAGRYERKKFRMQAINGGFMRVDSPAQHRESNEQVDFQGFCLLTTLRTMKDSPGQRTGDTMRTVKIEGSQLNNRWGCQI